MKPDTLAKTRAPTKQGGHAVVKVPKVESAEKRQAKAALKPSVGAAIVTDAFNLPGMPALDLVELMAELDSQVGATSSGDLSRPEAMLTAQAHTLNAIFNRMAMAARSNFDKPLETADVCMKLALRAQSQCRATLETLASIKNPPVVYAKQANIAHGPQQVNNGAVATTAEAAPTPIQARETGDRRNKLLEASRNGQRMDAGAKSKAGRGD